MRMNLTELEIRVLGCLMEKELTTPEYYPLTLNALAAACNQKSNRDPVLSLSELDLQRGLEALGARGLARLTTTGGRVNKYVHSMGDKLGLAAPVRAVLAELMLRGPQTAAELRGRSERMAEVGDLAAVEEILLELQQHGPPLVVRLPRQPGRKESRYAQVFAGMPEFPEEEPEQPGAAPVARPRVGNQRLEQLEQEVGALRDEIGELRREVEEMLAAFS
ncbi:YceH family protein [Geomonas propionica]|uniref:YceH family protein n=1 Tax=Geomonas propionica TaxID=2798582 RepID=A0ABS0YM32_9BACT|nr:YceH family protein [Geomonas propionica]MBJ6798969.1 YceH family protein [Geomonas propionica]